MWYDILKVLKETKTPANTEYYTIPSKLFFRNGEKETFQDKENSTSLDLPS